jgi:flagella basal body P-ring formation protein FlgA
MFNLLQLKLSPHLRLTGCVVRRVVMLSVFVVGGVSAQVPTNGSGPEFLDAAQRWLDSAVAATSPAPGMPLRMEVKVGALDSRLKLASCAQVEPFVPVGTRLWGKTRLGLRCLDAGVKWSVFLPVTVKAYGQAWVVKGNVMAGATLSETDVMLAEVDWAEETSPIVGNPAQWLGQTATRALMTGQALRQGMIKPPQVFQAGAQVRVVAQGPGFQISSDAQALSAGVVGQLARVKMENGRIMSGLVLDTRTVKLEM